MLRNTTLIWGAVAKTFHWLMAFLILLQFPLGWWMTELKLSPTKLDLFIWHKSIGVLVLLLAAMRVIWRFSNRPPVPPPAMPGWERWAAKVDHWSLYLLMVVVPLSGWVIDSASAIPFRVFWLFSMPRLTGPDKALEEAAKEVHEATAYILLALLALHVGAALWHHFVRRDEILTRMLPAFRKNRP